ncbi:MAG: hypothetical protein ACE5GO_08210 [Anaerolineales bacterium]
MVQKNKSQPLERRYPPFYEKAIPIAIGVLVVVIIGVLIFTIAVALGLFAG